MRTSEVLLKAANLIEERGWVQGGGWPGYSVDAPEGLCVEGGLMAALGLAWGDDGFDQIESCPAYRAVVSYLGDAVPGGELWRWNDAWDLESGRSDRTKAGVLETLRAAALIEAAKETASEFVITTSEAHCKAVARKFGLTPAYVDDRIYVTRWDDCRETAFVYSARVRVGAV